MARNKSGSARSRCSDRNRAGSILLFAVIAWCSFVDFGRSLKDHAVAASHHDATLNNAAPSYTTSVDSTPRISRRARICPSNLWDSDRTGQGGTPTHAAAVATPVQSPFLRTSRRRRGVAELAAQVGSRRLRGIAGASRRVLPRPIRGAFVCLVGVAVVMYAPRNTV